ncbi:MAG: zinc dependent phospholipase C family protein [Nanoarchaeota archaeon]|nr:zinc dependent phospholipase C family protein [Nanoarchaeota archaeon]
MFEITHAYLMEEAIKLLEFEELKSYKKQLIGGVVSPDAYYRAAGHFFNPETGKGIKFFGNAKDKGIKAYRKAVKCYKNGNKKKACFQLGRAAHFLMDMTVPAHTIFTIHLFSTDDLEIYMLNNPIMPKNAKPISKELESYFTDAANESRKMKTMPNGLFISLKFRYFGKKQKLPEEELEKQARIVASRAVSYSAGLIRGFFNSL